MDVRSDGKYLEALKKIGRLADERLDRQTYAAHCGPPARSHYRGLMSFERHD